MSPPVPYETLRVVHFSTNGQYLQPAHGPEPSPLAPWRTWLEGGYRPVADLPSLRGELQGAPGAVILLLHEGDLQDVLDDSRLALEGWIAADPATTSAYPGRQIILFGRNLSSFGDCARDEILRLLDGHDHLAECCPSRLIAMPWEIHLLSNARPVAWAGHLIRDRSMNLDQLSRRFPEWRREACEKIVGLTLPRPGSGEEALWEGGEGGALPGLRGYLTAKAEHAGTSHGLLRDIWSLGDTLWLLEGIVQSDGYRFEGIARRLAEARRVFEGWLARTTTPDARSIEWPATKRAFLDVLGSPGRLGAMTRGATRDIPTRRRVQLPKCSDEKRDAILVIDDFYDGEDLGAKASAAIAAALERPSIGVLVADGTDAHPLASAQVELILARDYPRARPYLNDPRREIKAVLLDEMFEHEDSELVNTGGQMADGTHQGFSIAETIHEEFGLRRPPVLMFTRVGHFVTKAQELLHRGVLDHYQNKPEVFEEGHPDFEELVRLLKWQWDPLERLLDSGVNEIDGLVVRFLRDALDRWRRDTPAMLRELAASARLQAGGRIDFESWASAQAPALPEATHEDWRDVDLWEQLLAREFGRCRSWPAVARDAQGRRRFPESGERVRHFEIEDPGEGETVRMIALLDPRALPALSPEQCGRGGRTTWKPLTRSSPAFQLGCLALPRLAPGSTLPWLVGFVFERPRDGDWTTLSSYRSTVLDARSEHPDALAIVAQALAPDDAPDGTVLPGWGLLADVLLIDRAGRRRLSFDAKQGPFVNLELLGLHPDPASRAPASCPSSLVDWLHAFVAWFALGRWPTPSLAGPGGTDWGMVHDLIDGRAVDFDLISWWNEEPGPDARSRRRVDDRTIALERLVLGCSSRLRPVGLDSPGEDVRTLEDLGRHSLLQVRQAVDLRQCELRVDGESEELQPTFKGLRFTAPVFLDECQVLDQEGRPAPLIIEDCLFEAGLRIKDLHASSLILLRCSVRLEGQGEQVPEIVPVQPYSEKEALWITLKTPVPTIRLEQMIESGEIGLEGVEADEFSVVGGTRIRLKSVRLRGALILRPESPQESGECPNPRDLVEFVDVSVGGDLEGDMPCGVGLKAKACTFGTVRLSLAEGMAGADFSKMHGRGDFWVLGPQSSQSRPIAVRFAGSELRQSLRVSGSISLELRERTELARDLICSGELERIEIDSVDVAGAIELAGVVVRNGFLMRRAEVGRMLRAEGTRFKGGFEIHASRCRGGLALAHCEFETTFCIARPSRPEVPVDGKAEPAGLRISRDEHITGVVLREPVDFSDCVFHCFADFSNAIVEHEAKLIHARFHRLASFEGVQAGSNLLLHDAEFYFHNDDRGKVIDFSNAIVRGVLDLRGVCFGHPVRFDGASLESSVRSDGGRWKFNDEEFDASFRGCACAGLLDLSGSLTPEGTNSRQSRPLQIDLRDVTVGRLNLDLDSMFKSIEACAAVESERSRIATVYELFETALLREKRFEDADKLFRQRKDLVDGRWTDRWLFGPLWAHGTSPWRVFWIALTLTVGYLFLAVSVLTAGTTASHVATGVFAFAQAILLNLFVVALARKYIR